MTTDSKSIVYTTENSNRVKRAKQIEEYQKLSHSIIDLEIEIFSLTVQLEEHKTAKRELLEKITEPLFLDKS